MKNKQELCKYDSMFPYLQSNTLFKWPLKFFISKMNDDIPKEKYP